MKWIICILFAVMTGCYLLRQHIRYGTPRRRGWEIFFKCAATSMAALLALLACMKNGIAANWVMLAGLVICTAADGVLCRRFVAGGMLFTLGHVLYIVAFCLMNLPGWRSLILFACLMGLTTSAFTAWHARIGRRYAFFYAYAVMLCTMVAMAASQRPLFLTGALLFAFSDGLLGYLMLDRRHVFLDYVSLGAYYLGQFLLALAMTVG